MTDAVTETHTTPALPDRYTGLRRVARGGMGEVWHARDTRLDRDVAIKLLASGDGVEDEATRRARFEREAKVVARLSTHPNVITIYDVGEVDDHPYLAMEWMDGGTLATRLAASPPPIDELLDTLARVASALDAAHADGIVHRDVKPGNVMFDAHGTPRIGDFGIATFAADPAMTLTQAGSVVGTCGYIAPEQANGSGAEPASDQYALMVIAFEALTGARPYARDSLVAELAAHVSEPIPSAIERAPHLPATVDRVFDRALAKDPGARHASCARAVEALRSALDDPAPTRVLASSVPMTPPATVTARLRRRVGLVAVLVLVGMLALLLGGAFGDDPDPEQPVAKTTTTAPATSAPDPQPAAERRDEAIARHERSFAALQAGRFQQAYDLGMSALADLRGVSPQEAFANYNVGAALVGLRRCDEAFAYLDRSEQLQGQRAEIDAARAAANECVAGDERPGRGKARGKGRERDGDDD